MKEANETFNLKNLIAEYEYNLEQRTQGMTSHEINQMLIREMAESFNSKSGDLEGHNCPRCLNRGYFMQIDKDGYKSIRKCECVPVRANMEMIKNSGLEAAVEEMTFEGYNVKSPWQEEYKNLALRYIKELPDKWFMLCGQVGSGKTHLCTAIVGELFKRNIEVVYLLYREDITRIKRYALDNDMYQKTMSRWQKCEVLYIDDLFKAIKINDWTGKANEADIAVIFEIIDYRARNHKRTIISTELTFGQLLKLDESIGSRILTNCGSFKREITPDAKKNSRTRDLDGNLSY